MATQSGANSVFGVVVAALVCATVFLVAIIGIVAIPIGIGAFIAYRLYLVYYYSDSFQEKRAREHTYELYRAAQRTSGALPDEAGFVDGVLSWLRLEHIPRALRDELIAATRAFYETERFRSEIPPPPAVCNSIEGAKYRDFLSSQSTKLTNPQAARVAQDIIVEAWTAFLAHLPPLPESDDASFSVPLSHFIKTPLGEVVEDVVLPFFREEARNLGLFSSIREMLERNMHDVSGIPYLPEHRNHPKLTLPSKYAGENVSYAYLSGTPFLSLFDVALPFTVPALTRFEHQWIVAPPGAGKSTLLQHLLLSDFARVGRNEASVIVIDSNRDLAKSIERLKCFAPGGDLEGKLILIDVEDVEYPVAINIFDTQTSGEGLSPRDREVLYNSSVSMLTYIFHALLGAEMTSRQSTLFNFTIELLLALPEPTLDTLIDVMQPDGLARYVHYIPKLSPDAQRFFDLKFSSKEFAQTKSQVVDRLFAVKRIRALARIFSSPKTKLNLFEELAQSKVIVINAAKSVLQEDGVEIFTRFFLANILLAAEKRQLLPKSERLDTYLYIDECQDVIRRDERLPVVLDQARKLRLGCVLAHQRLGQMSPPVLSALMGSTAIKFAANLADTNLGPMVSSMHTTSDFLQRQPPFHFAAYARGTTDTAVSLVVPHVDFGTMEHMTDEEHQEMQMVMRERYATRYVEGAETSDGATEEGQASVGFGYSRNEPPTCDNDTDLDNPTTYRSPQW